MGVFILRVKRRGASHLRGLRRDSKAGAICGAKRRIASLPAGRQACLPVGGAGSGRLVSDERSEEARLSDRDRIPASPRLGKNRATSSVFSLI